MPTAGSEGDELQGYVTLENGTRVYYEIRGAGEQTLMVPAACFLSNDIDPLIDGRRVVFFDTPGRGASDAVTDLSLVTWDAAVDTIEAVREALGIDRMCLWGWSIGGGVACRYAMDFSERLDRLLVSGFLPPRNTQPTADEAKHARARAVARVDEAAVKRVEQLQAEGLDQDDPAAYCRELHAAFRPFQMGRPEAAVRSRNDPCQHPNEWGNHWREMLRALSESKERERSGRVGVPTLVLHGSEEPFPLGSSRDWTWTFTDARLLVIDGVAHFPWLEAPDAFFSVVENFLRGHWPEEGEVIGERRDSALEPTPTASRVSAAPKSLYVRMSEGLRHRWPRVADEGLRLLGRLALLVVLILIVFPHLPGVRFAGSALVAVMLAVPFAVLGRWGHSEVRVSSVNPEGRWIVTKSRSVEALTARRWGWIVVAGVWVTGFVIVPSVLLRLFALVPTAQMEFRGWWSTLLPVGLIFLVHVLAVSVASQPRADQL